MFQKVPHLKPMTASANYLDYKDKCSQVWYNKYTITLALVIVKVYLFKASVIHSIHTLSKVVSSSINQYNNLNKKFEQLPNQYADTVNQLVVSQINSVKVSSLFFIILLFESCVAVVKFVVEVLLGTILCVVNQFVEGFIDFALDLCTSVLNVVNTIVQASTVLIQQGLKGLTDVIEGVSDTVNSVSNFFTDSDAVNPSKWIDDINDAVSSLKNISIPDRVFNDLHQLSDKIPDFDDLQDDAFEKLTEPIAKFVNHVNSSRQFAPIHLNSLNNNTLAIKSTDISAKSAITYLKQCEHSINYGFKVIVIVLGCCAGLAMLIMGIKEYYDWKRKFNMYLDITRFNGINEFQFLNTLNTYSNSVLYYMVHKSNFGLDTKIIWFVSYIGSSYSLFLLSFVVAGTVALILEYILFNQAQTSLRNFPMDELVSQFTNSTNVSAIQFIRNTNLFIGAQESQMNQDLFGQIKNTSGLLSDSIDLFVLTLNNTLIEPFENTPFEGPVSSLVYCIITRKLIMISNGFDWVQNNLKIAIPRVPNQIITSISKAIKQPPTKFSFDEEIEEVIEWVKKMLITEACIVGAIGGIWIISAIIGVIIMVHRSRKVTISSPKRMTVREKLEYGLPFDRLP